MFNMFFVINQEIFIENREIRINKLFSSLFFKIWRSPAKSGDLEGR